LANQSLLTVFPSIRSLGIPRPHFVGSALALGGNGQENPEPKAVRTKIYLTEEETLP
jgi:hypothetical protein